MIDIKEYAQQKNVTTQAVYKQISAHKSELEGHIKKVNGKRWLDDEAVAILNKASNSAPTVIMNTELEDKLAEALAEKETYKLQFAKEQGKVEMLMQQLAEKEQRLLLLEGRENEIAFLTSQNAVLSEDNENKGKTIQELEERLKNEETRKIKFTEWWKERR